MAGDAQIKITADTRDAERKIKDLERSLEQIQGVGSAAGKALAGITAAAAAMTFAVTRTINNVGDLADTAKALGVSVQNLQYLQQSAQLAGIGADQLNASLMRLQGSIGDALVKGTGPANDALQRLNVNVRDIAKLPADQQLKKIGEELSKIPNPAERSALAIDLLGKQGPRLLEAASAMEKMRSEAERLGIALSDTDVAAIEAAGDALDELAFLTQGVLQKAAAALAPYFIAIVDEIKKAIDEAGGFENVLRNIRDAIELAVKAAVVLATVLVASKIAAGVIAAYQAFLQMYSAIKVATGAAQILNTVLGKNPIIKIVGALVAIGSALWAVEAVDDLFKGLDEKAESIRNNIQQQTPAQKAVADAAEQFNQAQQKALDALGDTITKLAQNYQYQQDITNLGETEALVRKTIREEQEKLSKVGLTLSDSQKQMIRLVIQEGEERKRLTQITKEQASTINELLVGTSSLGKEVNKLREIQLQFQGYSKDDIAKINEARALAADPYGQMAMSNQRKKINDAVNAELGKYDLFLAAREKYQKDMTALDEIELQRQAGNITLTLAQEQALANSRLMIEKQYQDDRLKAVQDMNNRIRDIELRRIEDTLMQERSGMAQVLSDRDRALLQKIGQDEKQKAIVAERISFEKKSEFEKAQWSIQQGSEIFNALGAQNKKAFEAAKAFNIANAIMNTYAGATKALATYPWPFGLVAAAAAVAAGMAQVAAIRSQSYSGRALGGPVMGGQPYIVGESGPELFTPNTTGSITRNSDLGGGTTNVNFTIVANDSQGFDDLLLQRKGMITQMISDAMLERGSRSMV